MSIEMLGILGILFMFVLMILRFPISMAMIIPAFIGITYLKSWGTLATAIETIIWNNSFSYTLATIPLFILMGELIYVSGISGELFDVFRNWMGKFRGGLAMATIAASGMFAAVSGSALANTGTMGVIATKEMTDSGYNKSLAAGSVIAGGTLGVLIPPSTIFIIYGMLAEQSIGKLLIAGIVPGILLAILYMLTIYIIVLIRPGFAPTTKGGTWKERFQSLRSTIFILILFIIVIGGMYIGVFAPTEAAGVGATGAFIIALMRRKLTFNNYVLSASKTLRTTGFLFAIILSAFVLNYFLAITRVPDLLLKFLSAFPLPNFVLFALIILMYLLLGAVMDSMAMIVITIPIVLPLIEGMGFDLIWFGVIIVLVIEMAGITPPLGMNVFVLKGVTDIELHTIFKGALVFIIPILTLVVLLYLFPQIATYLPNLSKQ